MDLFDMNDVSTVARRVSPQKKSPVRPTLPAVLEFSKTSSLATPPNRPIAQNTPSSIHLSEFLQPPQGTSTPAPGTDLYAFRTPDRPPSYPPPVFRFNDSYDDTDASVASLHFPNMLSPSPVKTNRASVLKEELSSIVERIKTSVTLTVPEDDVRVEEPDTDFSLPDVGALSMVPLSEATTSTPKGIMKKSSEKRSVSKRVRINDTVDVIMPPLSVMKQNKRPLSAQLMRMNKKKMKSFKMEYDELKRAAKDRDPLNLLLG